MLALQENQPINVYANGCPLNMTDNLVHTRLLKKHVHKSPKLSNVLVCIGAQKAGTSWLFQNLTKDERFAKCMFAKEVHYFDHLYKNSPHLNNWRAVHFLKVCQGDKDKLKQLTPFISAMLADDASLLQALIEDADGLSPALARRIGLLTKKINDDRGVCFYCGQCNRSCKVYGDFSSSSVLHYSPTWDMRFAVPYTPIA